MCFHILGFDVMLTDECEPIVIEVNHTPSFETETPLDYLVKKNCIKDTLKLMRITQKNKRKNFERAK
jgi:tubulin polyglutamylase TTLL6/13